MPKLSGHTLFKLEACTGACPRRVSQVGSLHRGLSPPCLPLGESLDPVEVPNPPSIDSSDTRIRASVRLIKYGVGHESITVLGQVCLHDPQGIGIGEGIVSHGNHFTEVAEAQPDPTEIELTVEACVLDVGFSFRFETCPEYAVDLRNEFTETFDCGRVVDILGVFPTHWIVMLLKNGDVVVVGHDLIRPTEGFYDTASLRGQKVSQHQSVYQKEHTLPKRRCPRRGKLIDAIEASDMANQKARQ